MRRMPLTFSANKRLYAAALSRFGGWHAALAEAGVPKAARPLQRRGRKNTVGVTFVRSRVP